MARKKHPPELPAADQFRVKAALDMASIRIEMEGSPALETAREAVRLPKRARAPQKPAEGEDTGE